MCENNDHLFGRGLVGQLSNMNIFYVSHPQVFVLLSRNTDDPVCTVILFFTEIKSGRIHSVPIFHTMKTSNGQITVTVGA